MGVITPFITSTVPPRRACYHVPIKKHGSRDQIEVGLLSIFEVLQGLSKVAGRMPLGQPDNLHPTKTTKRECSNGKCAIQFPIGE